MKNSTFLLTLALIFCNVFAFAQESGIKKSNEFEATLQVAQTSFDNWSGGGENTFSARSTLRYNYLYEKNKLKLNFNANARYGMNVIDGDAFKNEDEFKLNLLVTWILKDSNWSYGGTLNIRSQFSDGFTSRTDDTFISSICSPAYIDLSTGFSYNKPNSPLTIVISPLTGSSTIVASERLSEQGAFGVKPGRHILTEPGGSLDVRFDKKFAKNICRFRSNLFAFCSYEGRPTFQWDNTLDIIPTKWLIVSLTGRMHYDEYANIEKPKSLQYNYGFSVGLSYLFKTK